MSVLHKHKAAILCIFLEKEKNLRNNRDVHPIPLWRFTWVRETWILNTRGSTGGHKERPSVSFCFCVCVCVCVRVCVCVCICVFDFEYLNRCVCAFTWAVSVEYYSMCSYVLQHAMSFRTSWVAVCVCVCKWCLCVCLCVCAREREREQELMLFVNSKTPSEHSLLC